MPIERLPFEDCNATGPGWTATFDPSLPHPQFRLTSDWATARLFWANGSWLLIGGDAPKGSESWTGPEDGTVDARAWRWLTTNALQILEEAARLDALEKSLRRCVGSSSLRDDDLLAALQAAWDHSPALADLLGQHEERVSGFVLREEALRLREHAVEQREEQVRRSWQALDAALLFDVNDVIEALERRLADDGFSPDTYRRLLVLRDAQKLQTRDVERSEVPRA